MNGYPSVRGRFAPSPTGRMHLGNALSALIGWLEVRRCGGVLVLRLEDLDPDRSKQVYADLIQDDLRWLGLHWDEGWGIGGCRGPYRQEERRELYGDWLRTFEAQGLLYPCYCSRSELRDASAPHPGEGEPIYSGRCSRLTPDEQHLASQRHRPSFRLRVPDETIRFTDLNFGDKAQNLRAECGDFIVRRSDGVHAYQLAVSVDDALMGINRVVRGEDLLESTARQIYIQRLMNHPAPVYGHVPLLMGEDGKRLSKRHRATDLGYWKAAGVSPEWLVGFLAYRSGLTDRLEALKPEELTGIFSWERLMKGPVVLTEAELAALEAKGRR